MEGRGRVLVIDDDPLLGPLLRRVLGRDYEVTATTSAKEALRQLGARETFDLILCDMMMPEMTGAEVHARLALVAPELLARVVFITGGTFTPGADAFVAQPGIRVLAKPFNLDDLRAVAREHRHRDGSG
jgi:CheY-like chemotaxis protein